MFSNLKQTFTAPNTSFGFSSNVTPNPFGQSAFGKTPSTGFGTPAPAFGQQSTPLFGQATQHGSLFASAAPTNTFGQTVNPQPTFGSGMFGNSAAQPSGSGLFGAANTSTFGQQNKTAGFGFGTSTANTGFGFGQTATQVQPQQQSTGLFGQTSSNLFGQSSGGFGANTTNNQIGTVIKFTPVTGTDTMVKGNINQTISTRHHCITCMKEYENKSLEELRWEDYQVNRKGPQQGTQPAGGLFGNMPQPVGAPLFGSAVVATSANTLFGQQENKSVFGQTPTATGFGQTTPAFGAPQTSSAGAGLFGKPLTGFGTATTSSAFPFSSTAQSNNLFGSNTAAKPVFGVSSQPNSLFGQPTGFGNQSTFGSFGAAPNQNVGLFNQNKATPFSIMPTSTTNTFGSFATQAVQNTNSLFSGAKPNTGGFGVFGQTNTAPVFGQPSFGQPNQGGLFNSSFNKTATPLFGQTQTTNALGTGLQMGGGNSLFGSNINKPNTMFGNNLGLFNSGFGANTNAATFNMGTAQPGVPNQDHNQTNTELQIISMSSTPYGIPALLSNISEVSTDLKDCTRPTNPSELNALLNTVSKSHTAAPAEKLKPVQNFGRKVPMFDGLEHRDESLISNVRINTNPKRLIVRNHFNKNKDTLDDNLIKSISNPLIVDNDLTNLSNRSLIEDDSKETNSLYPDLRGLQNELTPNIQKHKKCMDNKSTPIENKSSMPICSTMIASPSNVLFLPEITNDDDNSREEDGDQFTEASESQDWQTEHDSSVRGLTDQLSSTTDTPDATDITIAHPTGIILNRPEYYTVPSLDELVKYISEDGSCVVKGFTVGRYGYGNVYFSEAFDVSNLNLDELVHFRHKEINIYPDDSKKPPQGQGLNRKAQVTLDKVWPLNKKIKGLITDVDSLTTMDYAGRLRRLCERQNTRFVEYRPDTGSWVFKVEHFSKYGHRESDDEDEEIEINAALEQAKGLKPVTDVKTKHSEIKETETITTNVVQEEAAAFTPVESFPNEKFGLKDIVDFTYKTSAAENNLFLSFEPYPMYSSPLNESTKCTLMKSTFFEDIVEYEDTASDVCSSEAGILELSNYVSNSSPNREVIDDYDDHYLSESESIPLDICEGEILDPHDQLEIVSYKESSISSIDSQLSNYYNIADMAAFKGKSFKVGWTKMSTMLCLAKTNTSENDNFSYDIPNYRSIAFRKLSNLNENTFQSLEKHLDQQFIHSTNNKVDEIPLAIPLNGSILLRAHQQVVENLSNDNYEKQIWGLLCTLFDTKAEENIFIDMVPRDMYNTKIEKVRKHYLSSWIKSVVESTVEKEVNDSERDDFSKILSYISGNQIDKAAEFAMNSNNMNLALLISQMPTSKLTQVALETQLEEWDKCDVYDFLDEIVLKIYAILSGSTMIKARGNTISVFEGMDWIRILALYFWYVIKRKDPISVAVNMYEQLFDEQKCALLPTPKYDGAPEQVYDLRFQLLKFYSDKGYPITHIFNTFTHTNDPLDYRLGWFMCQIFRSLNRVEISTQAVNHMHINFAVQLEQMGLWHWAVYILTHIENNFIKRELIQNMLARHIQLRDEETPEYKTRETILIQKFKIPPEWVESEKALRAIQNQNYKDAVQYLYFANEWKRANDIVVRYLLPQHLLSSDYKYIIELLTPLSKHSELLSDWEEAGGLIFDFAKLQSQYNDIISLNDPLMIKKQLISFRSAVINVSVRFKHFVSLSHLHDVCVAEMAGRTAVMLRKLLTIINGHTLELCIDTAINAQTLPLTSDYLKQELNSILIDFLEGNQPKMIYL